MLVNLLDQNDDGFPSPPVTDPIVRERIIAWYAQQVYDARMEAEAMLAGLLPPPPPNPSALACLRRAQLRSTQHPRHRRALRAL